MKGKYMNSDDKQDLWQGLEPRAREALQTRSYEKADLATRLSTSGVEASELTSDQPGPKSGLEDVWIPGVEIFHRQVYQQPHRGWFAEFARMNEGRLHDIGLWPQQWATATMFANTAKGFHIHPPSIPETTTAVDWFQKLYVEEPQSYDARPYAREQWDAMFFVQGTIEFFLVDERAGMPRRIMRFIIEGDNRPGASNIGLVIPAGIAHALRCASSQDVIMVYGTSTSFEPTFEGRIASNVEECALPQEWQDSIDQD